MGKKILIGITCLVFILLLASILILSSYSLKLKKQIGLLDEQIAYQKCFPPLQEMLTRGMKGNLGDEVIFSSVYNFKKGLPNDLPADFSLFSGVEPDKIFSFPFPYDASFGVRKGIVFSSFATSSEILNFYSQLFQSKGWSITSRSEDTRLAFWRIIFSKENEFVSVSVYGGVPNFIPQGLGLSGQSITFFRYR